MKEYERFERIGTEAHRSYYVPFAPSDEICDRQGIIDRTKSSRFISLNGEWKIKQHAHADEIILDEELDESINVPSCVQMHGYDGLQYLNTRYPFPVMLPHIPYDNPTWHYRRTFTISKEKGSRYYLNFEGVDCAFYLYVNSHFKGYSQISHATSEFDITELICNGENTIDVFVLKWSVSTYLECQDKFRFSGIFRDVYILVRPNEHITDYKIETELCGNDGILVFKNLGDIAVNCLIDGIDVRVEAGNEKKIRIENVQMWTADAPHLYVLRIYTDLEVIEERIGFRCVSIDGCVFKINGEPVKLKGVNRHDFNCETGATVSLDDMAKDIKLMKELNVNAVRTSHYPNPPEFYLLCDAYGIYVMDEADLEMHGAGNRHGYGSGEDWSEYAENEFFSDGILDRHMALVERDKNRPSVIIWSLGNESSFGKAFFDGARYIKQHDTTRPVHYEGLQAADHKYYYTDMVDMVSMMYPSKAVIYERVLNNEQETRPFVLCEYTHAMGNSCGDISEYWDMIYNNEQMMGAFVWEWADHGIKTENGFLYGGDFHESEHDGNFCIDGLLTPDRKLKSGALEMKAVYGGKTSSDIKDIDIPKKEYNARCVEIKVDEHTGDITSIAVDKHEILRMPMHLNITRYIDNDMHLRSQIYDRCKLHQCKPHIFSYERVGDTHRLSGVMAANCLMPAVEFDLEYTVIENKLKIAIDYKLADYVSFFPRFGIELAVDGDHADFEYIGYGPSESYIDKHVACEYGYYRSNTHDNYTQYIRPQESGSHYGCKYLEVTGVFRVTAKNNFSFSANPYTTEQLRDTAHAFELEDKNITNVCIDIAMRGIGSHSCGPTLDERYEIPRQGSGEFIFEF